MWPRSRPTAAPASTAAVRSAAGELPAPVAVGVALLGGVALAVQGVVNGGLAERLGTPVVAALVSNGVATFLLVIAALTLRPVRAGLGRLRSGGLRWWNYLGGVGGALFVAGSAMAVPILGVALVTVVQVCGTSVGGIVTDRTGLGPTGRLPVTAARLGSVLLAALAVGIAQLGRPVGQLAVGLLGFILVLGVGIAIQSALNGRVIAVARNVGSASLVNALVGTAALTLAGLALAGTGHLHPHSFGGGWWLYLGGFLSLLVVGANLTAIRSLGVLRTGLAMIAGQLVGGLLLDALVPGQARPSSALVVGAALTVAAVLLSGIVTSGTRCGRRAARGPDSTV